MRNPNALRLLPESEDFAVALYEATRTFPKSETFGLTAQLRRAAVSIGSNIAEGCGRQSDRAFLPFLHNALGSTYEVQFQLRLATRLQYGSSEEIAKLDTDAAALGKQLTSLIKVLKSRA